MVGRGIPLNVLFFTIEYIAISSKTSISPTLSGESKEYSPIISPARQVCEPKRYVKGFSPESPEFLRGGLYGISRTSGIWQAADVSRMAIGISFSVISRTFVYKYPAFKAIASPGSR